MAKTFFLVLLFLFLLVSFRLGETPVYLNQDEVMFALNAKNIAESGTDYYGNKLPFYFWHLDNFWATPIIVYFSGFFLKFLPFNEASTRLPVVFLAIINIGLLMCLVHLIFKDRNLVLFSGILLALTPAFFINSRLLLDNIFPTVFILLWLLFLYKNNLFLAGLSLGVGIHSYHAAKIYMPLYLLGTLIYVFAIWGLNWKKYALLILGFLAPLIVFIPWLINHPDTWTNQFSYISSIDRSIGSNFALNLISYFDPSILFSTGDRTLIHSTGRVGAFLFPTVFLLVFGIFYAIKTKDNFSKLILFGFLTFPIAPALINDPERISRAFVAIPFAVLLSVYGIKFLLSQKDKVFRYLLIFILLASIFQFSFFLYDYFGDYRIRSYRVFNGNVGGAIESAINSTQIRPVEKIYIDRNIFAAKFYFEFYERKKGIDFSEKMMLFDSNKEDFTKFEKGSIVVVNRKATNIGKFELIETIRELDGAETYFVYFKDEN